ncbi:uncharacterized protein TNCV_4458651 [Trichonephila clavipes]|nr:uncharacterized protein TNCV_4458651 [Trichonephila clavipes]
MSIGINVASDILYSEGVPTFYRLVMTACLVSRKVNFIPAIQRDDALKALVSPAFVFFHKGRSRWGSDLNKAKDLNDDHREEITEFVQSIPGFQECDEEDVEIWMACDAEDYGYQMLNDDQIVTSVQEESDPVNDETNEDEDNNCNEISKGPSNADAFSALETAVEWYEQQSECSPTQLLLLKRIRDLMTGSRVFSLTCPLGSLGQN